MSVFVTFALGGKESYFFNSPTHWARHGLPPEVENLFTKQPPIKDVLEFALGEKGAYFISYRDADEKLSCLHHMLPNPLMTYLYNSQPVVIRDLSTLSVTLGPYESYYACDKSSASWANLPPALEKALLHRLESQDTLKTVWKENGREAPSFVSLGADSSYFMRTVGGGGSWDLRSKAEGMQGINKYLDGSVDFTSVAGLYLFPSYPDSYVLLLTTGKAFSNLPEHTWADYKKMEPALPDLTQKVSQPVFNSSFPLQPQGQIVQTGVMQPAIQFTGCCGPVVLTDQNCCPSTVGFGAPIQHASTGQPMHCHQPLRAVRPLQPVQPVQALQPMAQPVQLMQPVQQPMMQQIQQPMMQQPLSPMQPMQQVQQRPMIQQGYIQQQQMQPQLVPAGVLQPVYMQPQYGGQRFA